ncbi:hypothetical protein [Candidatus Methanoperedens nitratireducens]|uniref:NAD dependent epimerase/dehydratase family protein n=1 Tax=Candidatus Methanoperedens nitratireducens TaxID=1392998 RepID=A0A284VPK2_9EURY
MKNQRVMVAGGAGFTGSNLAGNLAEQNDAVILDNLSTGRLKTIKEFLKRKVYRDITGLI